MATLPAFLRRALCALICALVARRALAQELPSRKITGDDLRRALIWTGHFSVMSTGDPAVIVRSAFQSWQTSKGYAATPSLPDEQVMELLSDGDKQRDAFGLGTLEGKPIVLS